ncbi:MAG: hypothetical protein M3R15_09700 [Acidobacteriota bacterium]|nr:hypothetical protein [Acidobacteriota bacterium]
MNLEVKPLAEITHEALDLLCRHLGVANTARFVNQFTTGYGNYTEERRELFAEMSLDEIVSEIERIREDK